MATLSLILCSRNDQYMGNSRWRLQTALDYAARRAHELGRANDVEILVADWGSETPLRDVVRLGPEAGRMVRFLHIPPAAARRLQRDSPFPEVLALNAAARRAGGDYIGRIDQDTLVGGRFLRMFFDLVEGRRHLDVPVATALLFANQRMVPYRFTSRCPDLPLVERCIRSFGPRLPVELSPRRPFHAHGVGIWLAHRDLWHECGGYDERMIYMNDMEINMIERLRRRHVLVDLGRIVDYDFFHLEHYSPLQPRRSSTHRRVNPSSPFDRTDVINPTGADWGLARLPLDAPSGVDAEALTSPPPFDGTRYRWLVCVAAGRIAGDRSWLALRRLTGRVSGQAKEVFFRVFRSDVVAECRATIATRGLVPALNGTRHLRRRDRLVVATGLYEVFTRHPECTELHRGAVRGARYVLSQSALANRDTRRYLLAWGTELLRQHADMRDLFENTDIVFSPSEQAALQNSTLFETTWRLLVPMLLSREPADGDRQHIYCFGCAGGATVAALKFAFDRQGMPLPFLHLFDSFAGLPAEQPGIGTNSHWREGSFAFGPERLREKLCKVGVTNDGFAIHEGFFSDSLTPELAASGDLRPALYIDIDCDLYISTYQALDFMFAHGLATTGTYVGYDDWGDTREWTEGESRAHKEIADKYGVRFTECVSWGRAPVVRKLFRVMDRGSR
ncbi:MAG: hypothetical protein FJW23_05655 [Acidimicrobiia bacterium]|nr:hypothetical protein [Acidimicrobiia bacterium]